MLSGVQILTRAGVLLQDEDHTRWPLPELVEWVNEAVDAILLAKPSAKSMTIAIPMVEGTLQKVPTSGSPTPLRLIGVTRNVTVSGQTRIGGRAIRPVIRSLLDTSEPDWHDPKRVPFRKEVRQFIFDEENPLEFYVYPGNTGTGVIEGVVSYRPPLLTPSAAPDDVASYGGDVGLDQIYSGAVVDYVVYRAQQKDDFAANQGRAAIHYQNFATAIGLKIQVEAATSPNRDRKR
ncbi:DUF6682 family protein [Phreatobacter oligotrophus]|uniref:Uncharacterized protein n=1 Tax=Phreatobacter oligotrophus TaxID=1122261 RepID=A0A2T4ZIU5_9HYPH|nr:DUF6682 family protein [Phreatobacter oligotrophus]PTM61899.1 hypothetical protein C8P69_101571 [Phreatobacter oligotrophus]